MKSPFTEELDSYIFPAFDNHENIWFIYYVVSHGINVILDKSVIINDDLYPYEYLSLSYCFYLEDCELARLYGALPSELL